MTDHLINAYPGLAGKLRKTAIALLPTPVSRHKIVTSTGSQIILVKHDDQSSVLYGGNKVRKLEYHFQRAKDHGAERVATFGAIGSHHALATAIFAKSLNLECTCFLAHQNYTADIAKTLAIHLELGTEIVSYSRAKHGPGWYRRHLQNRNTWVIPLGGTSWLGALGFVNAGLELAAQINAGELLTPGRIYIANGTMGSVAGLAIGIALADLPIEIQAVRVADSRFSNRPALDRLMARTVKRLHRLDASVPLQAATKTKIVWRDEFFAGGYASVDEATTRAVRFAQDALGLRLETTYTGKAMAALLHDLASQSRARPPLFWNTFNSQPLPSIAASALTRNRLPEQFRRYYV